MTRCSHCGSFAINPHLHGRKEGVDLDLCDVCYWRKRAEHLAPDVDVVILDGERRRITGQTSN